MHSRCAVLNFNPKKNREVPPLHYEYVYELIRNFSPNLHFSLNGEVRDLEDVRVHAKHGVQEVMIGRAVQNFGPRAIDVIINPENDEEMRYEHFREAALNYCASAERENGDKLINILTPLMNLFNGMTGSRHYRRVLSEHMKSSKSPLEIFQHALQQVEGSVVVDKVEKNCVME